MWNKLITISLLIPVAATALSCEIDTKLSMKGGNPPTFVMTGNGILTSIRVRGHNRQRDAQGEDQYLYWVINLEDYDGSQVVGRLGSVIYGKMPKGYIQKYPEKGEAPALSEGEHYYVHVITSEANGADGYFMILNGKVQFATYESELPDKVTASK
jgi:hypothetical protein